MPIQVGQVAAYRSHGDSAYSGFYSKDLEEVVAYAAGYGIEVIPEIELPGLVRRLSSLSSFGLYRGAVAVATEWGVFQKSCRNEQTFYTRRCARLCLRNLPSKYNIKGMKHQSTVGSIVRNVESKRKACQTKALQGWFTHH